MGLMLLSQAELIKVGLAISRVMEAKRPDESKWSFEGCRCSLCGEERNRFKRAIGAFRGSGREHVMHDLTCEMSDDMKGEPFVCIWQSNCPVPVFNMGGLQSSYQHTVSERKLSLLS